MRQIILLVLAIQSSESQAAQRQLLDTLILGAAQGLILVVVGVLYFVLWRPYSTKRQAEKSRQASERIATDLPEIVLKAANGDPVAVTAMLDSGVDPNASGPTGQTALMLAARNGHTEVVKLLLARGADTLRTTKTGSTAQDIAKTYKHPECESLLTKAVAK